LIFNNNERKVTLVEVFKVHNDQIKKLIGHGFAHRTSKRYETSQCYKYMLILRF